MLGDTAVAMNPADKRAQYLVDKKVKLNALRIQSHLVIKMEKDVEQIEEVTVAMEKERIIRVPDQISTVQISPELIANLLNRWENELDD